MKRIRTNTRLPRFARNDGFMGGLGRLPLRKEKNNGKTGLPRFARNDEKMMCHSERSGESSPGNPLLEDPSV
jgi:hypothetical protein